MRPRLYPAAGLLWRVPAGSIRCQRTCVLARLRALNIKRVAIFLTSAGGWKEGPIRSLWAVLDPLAAGGFGGRPR